ncbi:WSC domain containing protein [Lasiodiplodia theobromae]|uniref:Peroxidase n=1 Tax=Lasiodiplodia theobromae TaxID=45133 RepID=A0A5N5CV45_9PEZI|nr:WSC domain containing protein [Lasiodiplodia theobromae]KAB2569182.1 WSC domain-containing protein [Lasiodiplodia theobromae]KAF4541442.1 WSC domain containing protein [Lasiodiplodia theobromae]
MAKKHPCLTLAWVTTTTILLLLPTVLAAPTWPSPQDELEDIMFLTSGHRSRAFPAPILPCGVSSTGDPGRVQAAEWIRTAFHDMAPGSVYTGVGGLDASIAYETRSGENLGPAFNTTLAAYAPFLSSRSSMADVIALGVYAAVRACGGPVVAVRTGRVDARAAGPQGVPLPQNSVGTFQNQFLRTGFSTTEMIQLVACGHTLGGVHADANPEIVPAGSVADDVVRFDTTDAFDNKVVTEYLANTTQNALVVGRSTTNGRNSDARVFAADGNATVRAMADPETFSSVCATVLQKMIEVVPSGVTLGDPIAVYDVKPSGMQLTLLDGGESIKVTGDIRVRTTERAASQIEKVQLVYKDREGGDGGTLDTESSGSAAGFDDTFEFYGVSANIPSDSSISSFNVLITLTSGETELHDNNGNSFPLQNSIIFQSPQSCLSGTLMTITAAVRSTASSAPTLNVTYGVPNSRSVLPVLTASTVSMTKGASIGPYDLYSASYTLTAAQLDSTRFDVKLASGATDSFKSSADLSDTCADLSPDPPSSSSSTTAAPPASSTSAPASSSSTSAPASSSTTPTTTTPTTPSTSTTPTPTPTVLACPDADGATWATASGTAFTIRCGKDYQAGQIGVTYVADFAACLAACVGADGCEAVAYVGDNVSGGNCYLKNEAVGAVDNEGVWGAVREG